MKLFDWFRRLFKRDSFDTFNSGGAGPIAGFAGGAVGRLTSSLATWSASTNVDLDGALVILRARGRQMGNNTDFGKRFLSLVSTNIVGHCGPTLQVRAKANQRDPARPTVLDKPANRAVETHWAKWCDTADITGRMDFAHLCRVAVKSVARDGEVLARKIRRRDLPYGFAIQLLEADRLDEAMNAVGQNFIIRQGVEMDDTGRPIALWVRNRHPGELYAAGRNDVERVPIADIIHLYLPERAEQVRGYSWFHAILVKAHQTADFTTAAVVAAKIGASKIAALERSDEAPDMTAALGDSQDAAGNVSMRVEAGEIFALPPGHKLSSWNPEYPHANFDSFLKAAMRGIAAGLDVAAHNLTGDMTDVNYSSARIAELSEREMWMVLQSWFIRGFVMPIYQEWLAIALLRGDIRFDVSGKALPADKLAKFADASRFQGRRWKWVNPQQEIDAAGSAIGLGITSRTRLAAEQGDDFDDILDELADETAALEAAGLAAPSAAAPQAPPVNPSE